MPLTTQKIEKLNKFLLKCNDEENILIMGDLNARVGNEGKLNDRFIEHLDHLPPDIEENPAVERSMITKSSNQVEQF